MCIGASSWKGPGISKVAMKQTASATYEKKRKELLIPTFYSPFATWIISVNISLELLLWWEFGRGCEARI
jgi:hypothetical protein